MSSLSATRLGYIFLPPKNPNAPQHPRKHCRMCGVKLEWPKRVWCSDECRIEHYQEYEPNKIYWPAFREMIIKERGHTCQECKYPSQSLEVHHIVPISKGGGVFDKDNVVVLCESCHYNKHRKRKLEPTSDSHQTFITEMIDHAP